MMLIEDTISRLSEYCEMRNFMGWDPYDGLNSKLFKATPFNKWPLSRLLWIQIFKRNPINLRNLALIPKGYNPKGLSLFLIGYCNLYKINPSEDNLTIITFLADKIMSLQTHGYSGACWGYNFDWQSRGGLFFPTGTPNVIVTTYSAIALIEAYDITKNDRYLSVALSSAEFIINDLIRTKKPNGFLFSYSPIKGNNTVYNASLMGSKLLSRCYQYTKRTDYAYLANESVKACIDAQNKDGSWYYGELSFQNWIDSFHTGYNLESIQSYQELCVDNQYEENLNKGLNFYINNFFLNDGTPKYYHNKTYPIDIHSPAQLFVTISKLKCFKENQEMASRVLRWTIKHMQNDIGYFYYQVHKYYTNKIPYIRWSQAFMFYGLSYYFSEMMGTKEK